MRCWRGSPATWSTAARVARVAARVSELLEDDAKRTTMGEAGRAWVSREWRWPTLAARLQELLQPEPMTRSSAVERVDLAGEFLHHDGALELE